MRAGPAPHAVNRRAACRAPVFRSPGRQFAVPHSEIPAGRSPRRNPFRWSLVPVRRSAGRIGLDFPPRGSFWSRPWRPPASDVPHLALPPRPAPESPRMVCAEWPRSLALQRCTRRQRLGRRRPSKIGSVPAGDGTMAVREAPFNPQVFAGGLASSRASLACSGANPRPSARSAALAAPAAFFCFARVSAS